MKNLIYISFIIFFAVSCKKETSVVIQAKDYNTGDGTAYAGQEYAVSESWTPFQETKSKIVATGFLDDNGKASFNLKMKNNRKYVLGVSEPDRSEEHTSELQSRPHLVCRLLLEKKKKQK